MIGKSRMASIAAAAAMTGLIGGAGLFSVGCHNDKPADSGTAAAATNTHNSCKAGMNECKGKGACKTATHACNGLNDCAHKGGGPS